MFGDPQYTIGNIVQLVRGGRIYTIIWRGQQQVRTPTGVYREWVYLLDNGHWDCYHEAELVPALRGLW